MAGRDYTSEMHFLDIPERLNKLLYKKEVVRLTRSDILMAREWTLRLIRDSHPKWSEEQVQADYERLRHVRVVAVDQWSKRNLPG